MPAKKDTPGPKDSELLELELLEITEGRHGERRILLAILRALIALLKTAES